MGAKDLGGRWTGDAWVFDERDEDRVRDLCLDVYGVQPGGVEIVDAEGSAQKARLAAAQKAMRAALDAGVSFEDLAAPLKEEHLG